MADCDKIVYKASQMTLFLKNSENVQFLGFFSGKKTGFFDKEPWNDSETLIVANVHRMRVKWYFCLRILKLSKSVFFSEKRWVYPEKDLEMNQNPSLSQNFLESPSNGIVT